MAEILNVPAPQGGLDAQILETQSGIDGLRQQTDALYGEIGREAFEREPDAWAHGAQLRAVLAGIDAGQEKLAALETEREAALAEAARLAAEEEAARTAALADKSRCKNCGTQNPENTRFCQECGTPFAAPAPPAKRFCGGCGAETAPGTKFCGGCGAKLE
jgi:hypothetical protein